MCLLQRSALLPLVFVSPQESLTTLLGIGCVGQDPGWKQRYPLQQTATHWVTEMSHSSWGWKSESRGRRTLFPLKTAGRIPCAPSWFLVVCWQTTPVFCGLRLPHCAPSSSVITWVLPVSLSSHGSLLKVRPSH